MGITYREQPKSRGFLDTLLKARKNPSKHKWYDAETGEVMNLNRARGAINSRYGGAAARYRDMEEELRTGVREYTVRGKVVKEQLTPEQLEKIANNKIKMENALSRDWTRKIAATSDEKLDFPKLIDENTGKEVIDMQKVLGALAKEIWIEPSSM